MERDITNAVLFGGQIRLWGLEIKLNLYVNEVIAALFCKYGEKVVDFI